MPYAPRNFALTMYPPQLVCGMTRIDPSGGDNVIPVQEHNSDIISRHQHGQEGVLPGPEEFPVRWRDVGQSIEHRCWSLNIMAKAHD